MANVSLRLADTGISLIISNYTRALINRQESKRAKRTRTRMIESFEETFQTLFGALQDGPFLPIEKNIFAVPDFDRTCGLLSHSPCFPVSLSRDCLLKSRARISIALFVVCRPCTCTRGCALRVQGAILISIQSRMISPAQPLKDGRNEGSFRDSFPAARP